MTYILVKEHSQLRAIRKGLLPCPHCGGKAGLWQAWDNSWIVQCDKCGATTMKLDKEEAIKRWNRRVIENDI